MKLHFVIFIYFVITLMTLSNVQSEIIQCKYTMKNYGFEDKRYLYCMVSNFENINDDSRIYIEASTDQHKYNQNSYNVEGFQISGARNFKFFPANLDQVFPNLITIVIEDTRLTEITKVDLEPFKKLKFLYLKHTLIEFIPENLFVFNPDLEVVYLRHNKIQHIDKMAFSGLEKLSLLYLSDNNCDSLGFALSREEVLELTKKIEQGSCQSDKFNSITLNKEEIGEKDQIISQQKQEIEELKLQLVLKDKELMEKLQQCAAKND